jgi:hypothetical protein
MAWRILWMKGRTNMIAQSPAVRVAPQSPVVTVPAPSRGGLLASLAAFVERAARPETNSAPDSQDYWTSVARGL